MKQKWKQILQVQRIKVWASGISEICLNNNIIIVGDRFQSYKIIIINKSYKVYKIILKLYKIIVINFIIIINLIIIIIINYYYYFNSYY